MASTRAYGTVTSVESAKQGSELTADAALGAMSLSVDFTADFDEGGGVLLLNGVTLLYTTVDTAAGTIALASPLAAAAVAGDPVQVVQAGTAASSRIAWVVLDEGDPVPATVPTPLIPYFPETTYDEPVEVELEVVGGSYRVVSQPNMPAMQVVSSDEAFAITDPDGNEVFSATDGPIKFWWQQDGDDSETFPNATWTEYLSHAIPVPLGYTQAFVMLFVSAGGTFTSAGNVAVQPEAGGFFGPSIDNGISSGPCSAGSMMARGFTVTPGGTFNISAWAWRNGPVTAGSNNVHLSASILFFR